MIDPIPSYYLLETRRLAAIVYAGLETKRLVSVTVSPSHRLLFNHRISVGYYRWYRQRRGVELKENPDISRDSLVVKYKDRTIMMQSDDVQETIRQLLSR